MLYDYLIFYTMDGVRREFLATATSSGRALEDLVRYVSGELGRITAEISDTTVDCEGPSAFQF
jgi:hypothetical protein